MNAIAVAPAPAPVVPLDPRVRRTRQLLREALVSLLGEKSFEAISVHDLAERATVNRVTFYDHYDDKFALLDDLIGESFRELLQTRLAEQTGEPCCRKFHALMLALCDYLGKLIGHCKIHHQPLFGPLVESRVKALLCEQIAAWLREETPCRLRVSPALGATLAGWSMYGAALEWSMGGQPKPAEEFAPEVLGPLAVALFIERPDKEQGTAERTA